jgi:hypothetical protein
MLTDKSRYQDYLDQNEDEGRGSKAYVLHGGIRQFIKEFDGNPDLIDRD